MCVLCNLTWDLAAAVSCIADGAGGMAARWLCSLGALEGDLENERVRSAGWHPHGLAAHRHRCDGSGSGGVRLDLWAARTR
eukprot:SAG31_NODE_1378_length_8588_cov_2.424382_8_plen_81_part_00